MNKYKVYLLCLIIASIALSGCSKSPISMVKNFELWQFSGDDKWADDVYYSYPTWEKVIKEYEFFANYNSSNWSDNKLGGQKWLHFVEYATEFNSRLTSDIFGAFVINHQDYYSVSDVVRYFKRGIRLNENKNYAGHNIIYSTDDKAKINEIISVLESGDISDVHFDNYHAILRWVTNTMADSDYGEDVIFIGTYIITDIILEKEDKSKTTDRIVFYVAHDDPLETYRYGRPFSFFNN